MKTSIFIFPPKLLTTYDSLIAFLLPYILICTSPDMTVDKSLLTSHNNFAHCQCSVYVLSTIALIYTRMSRLKKVYFHFPKLCLYQSALYSVYEHHSIHLDFFTLISAKCWLLNYQFLLHNLFSNTLFIVCWIFI